MLQFRVLNLTRLKMASKSKRKILSRLIILSETMTLGTEIGLLELDNKFESIYVLTNAIYFVQQR